MALSLSMEQILVTELHTLEKQAWEAIQSIPGVGEIRARFTNPKWTTRQCSLHSLEETVEQLLGMNDLPPDSLKAARLAKTLLMHAVHQRWRLVLEVEGLIRSEARRFSRLGFVGYEDLLQEGYIGALNAARRFESTRKVRFATYARWWIRAQITKSIEHQGRLVRLPGGAVELIRNIRKGVVEQETSGLVPDLNLIATDLQISRERVDMLLAYQGTVSMEQENPQGMTLSMSLVDDRIGIDPEHRVVMNSCYEACTHNINKLDSRQKYIIEHHFGLEGNDQTSLSQIGRDLGLSRERVRQIQKHAIRRLRVHL